MSSNYNHKDNSKFDSFMASSLWSHTKVESAYDAAGRFSHLIARLPRFEFIKLYSPLSTSTIFIFGYWLQLFLGTSQKRILERQSQTELLFEIQHINSEKSILFIKRKSIGDHKSKSYRVRLKKKNEWDLFETEKGQLFLARLAARIFSDLSYDKWSGVPEANVSLPVIHILPEDPQIDCFFNRDVFIH